MPAQALYRKWRPQLWDEVVGQDHVVQTLRNALRTDHVAHAYLFAGPRGCGKTTTARLVAKALNCLHPDPAQRPDNTCPHCVAVNEGRFLDLIEIDGASNNSVENVRELRDKINFAPGEGRFKIYIIDEVHMLSRNAFNALLKTLEEPPAHVKFLFATTEVDKLPVTVLSRCQRFDLRRIPAPLLSEHFASICEQEGVVAASGHQAHPLQVEAASGIQHQPSFQRRKRQGKPPSLEPPAKNAGPSLQVGLRSQPSHRERKSARTSGGEPGPEGGQCRQSDLSHCQREHLRCRAGRLRDFRLWTDFSFDCGRGCCGAG